MPCGARAAERYFVLIGVKVPRVKTAFLSQIDENLMRGELTALERSDHLKRRKAVYLMKHPETRHGGASGKAGGGKKAKDPKLGSFAQPRGFLEDTAERTGMSRSHIARSVHRAEAIAPDVREAIHAMPAIADKGVELDALAAIEPKEQRKAIEAVKSGKARNVREAIQGAKKRQRSSKSRRAPSDQEIVRRELVAAVKQCQKKITRRLSAVHVHCARKAIEVTITFTGKAESSNG